MYYRGQRLIPTPHNPIAYAPHDFAVFEAMESGGQMVITIVQKRTKVEPAHWWTNKVEVGQCKRRCLALYRGKVSPTEVLIALYELAPLVTWWQDEGDNPYKFQANFNGKRQALELDQEWVDGLTSATVRARLHDAVRTITEDLCQP